MPVEVGVKFTVHFAVAPLPERVQLAEENLPRPPLLVNVMVPVGVIGAPGLVSVTVIVQVIGVLGLDGLEHDKATETLRCVTVRPNGVAELGRWVASPP